MDVTFLGTGSPVPVLDRAGTSQAIQFADETVLVDCGPRAVYRLLEHHLDPSEIERIFFTHQHVDHNASFFHFAIAGWPRGRHELTLYGPGTQRLVDAMHTVYSEDIVYRQDLGYPPEGIDDISCHDVDDGSVVETPTWRVDSTPVEHSIETFAYRFTERPTGASIVFSGDTRELSSLADFAADADVLVHDCCIAPVTSRQPTDGFVWEEFTRPIPEERRRRLEATHSNATQAARIASAANVDTLVLTHLLPYRDLESIRTDARERFDGEIIIAEDGLTVEVGGFGGS